MMNIYQTQVEKQVCEIIEPTVRDFGYEIVRVKLMGSAQNKTLQITIDWPDDRLIAVDDCELVSRHVSVLLDVEDVIASFYNLEVSSPGISRPLTRLKDYKRYVGEKIKLTTKLAINGQRNFSGVMQSVDDSGIVMILHGSPAESGVRIEFANISDANLQPDLIFKQEKKNLNRRRK